MQPGNESSEPPWIWPRAAYIHVPFCAHHCGYCDFAIATGQDHLIDLYLEALAAEMARLQRPQPVQTIFLGGGTPSLLNHYQLERLLTEVRKWLPLSNDYECSIEVNPETLDREKVKTLIDFGVNRISLGVQSFQPHLLGALERNHDPNDIFRAMDLVRGQGLQASLDLIFGVPGQTLAEWQSDLRQALDLQPDHLSTYGLTFEKGTPLWKKKYQGLVQAIDEDLELGFYLHAIDTLEQAGFEHYEISNFARPGMRSRHNQVYWANEAYFGFGMGAARYLHGCREVNTRELKGYIRKSLAGEPTVFQSETLSPEERARETIALQIRRAEGIHRPAFARQTGFDLEQLAGPKVRQHVDLGLIEEMALWVRLTRRGKCVADTVVTEYL